MKIAVAKIVKPHGLKGLVKLVPMLDDGDNLLDFAPLFYSNQQVCKINSVQKASGKMFIVEIDGINTIEQADCLSGGEIFADRSNFPEIPVEKDEFYIVDLVGLKVIEKIDNNNNMVGHITKVESFPAASLVTILDQQSNKAYAYPFTKKIFPTIDVENDFVILDRPTEIIC